MNTCLHCNAPVEPQEIIHGYDGYKSYYECKSCEWWSMLETGNSQVGHFLSPVVKLFPHTPHDLCVHDLVSAINKMPRNTTPAELANFVQGSVCQYLEAFCVAANIPDEKRKLYEINTGLVPTLPRKEFTLPANETN
ncbi:hypothetical protein [Spirosoma sordidisoli]|uniref:Uncharacterized protein n=1 Tax=Spirosoma sordidisoli TaxID=2502893 RepID=A0A4Q2UMX5_9BACT|nr:hypothetical protein [Spirosoma sordidisoli]RYC70754.1 hypothetical protein EQG79_00955 [Spirosoma sordidisoli]